MDDQVTREQDLDLESDKVVLLNSTQICLIFECFKTTVEIGPISKRSTISQPKRVIKLTGTQSNIEKAKKYIIACIQPEVSVSISINNSIGDKVRSPSFTQQLIRQYPLTFQIHNNNTMKLKGHRDEVYAAEKYLKSLEKQQQSSNKMDFDEDDNDGSVICLSDPYEAFADDDDIVDKPTAKSKKTTTSKKMESTDKQAKEVAGRNQAASSLRSNRVESNDDSVICIDDGDGDKKTQFRNSALVRGFTWKQVDQVFSELNDKVNSMSETQFIQHLKNKFNADSRTISESDQNLEEKANKKPVIKQQQQTTSTPIPNKQLTEYAKLVEMQKFDLKHEEENKMGRISALINAMDSKDAKVDAMGKVLKYKEATSKKSSTNKGTIASRLVTDEEETSNSLLGYTAMMMDEDENNKHQPANNSSILPGYETMMMDEEEDKSATTKTATSKKSTASSPSKHIRPKSFLEEAAKMKKIQSDTNELQIIDDAKMTKPSRNENSSKNQNNQNTKKATESASAAAIANKPIQEAAVAEINELDKAMKELSNRQDIKDPLRYIIIDGSNVAMEHGIQTNGGQQVFSCMGIQIVVDHFIKRGHKNVKAFVPRFRRGMSDRKCPTTQGEILDELEKRNNLIYTPSRYVGNQLICPYDDRFILRAAQHYNAIIVSNDNYRDLRQENAEWDHLVKYNLLQYSFLDDLFMIADDPMGRHGPTIDEFLSNSSNKTNKGNNYQRNQLSSGQMKTSTTFGSAHNFHSNNNFKSYESTHKSNNNNRNGMSKLGSWSNLADTNYQTRSKQFNNPTNDFPRMASNTNNSNTGSYHAKGNKPRDSSSSRRGKKGRDMNENSTLYSGLLDIFPKSDAKIKQLLSDPSHSFERDLMFFANKILESNSNHP